MEYGVRPIAIDLLRETGKSANRGGSDLMGLVEKLEGLARGMGIGWEVEEG